jgi:Na+-transporting methylmalonyl-CoA/oxaloacetate decarboxylase gamma subunit
MISDKVLLTFGESLLLSGIGMLVVFMELIALALMIIVLSKVLGAVTGRKKAEAPAAPAPAPAAPAAPQAAPAAPAVPGVLLEGVDERSAAVIMAIVSQKSGIPLNRLSFRSIKAAPVVLEGLDEATAREVMAAVSKEKGIPLERLSFNSIKKVD